MGIGSIVLPWLHIVLFFFGGDLALMKGSLVAAAELVLVWSTFFGNVL